MNDIKEYKYITYDPSDGEPLAIFDTEETAQIEAMECQCKYCKVPYYPNDTK